MKNEHGAILPLTAISVVTFLLISGVMLTIGMIARERAQLRAAVDVALISATNVVCPTRECFERVRETAVETLKSNLSSSELNNLSASDLDEAGHPRRQWQTEHFTIEIDRGRWKPLEGFESVEGDWQLRHPGAPAHSLLYAVRMRVTSRINPIFKLIAPTQLSIEARATAIASPVEQRCVAPFALPLCALIDGNGDFDQSKLAHADRFFTSVDRFGGTSAQQVVPDFDYSIVPADALAHQSVLEDLFEGLRAKYLGGVVRSCEYPTTRYRSVSDQFGVVGLPGDLAANEELIQVLVTGSGCVPAVVGQRFQILPEGLSQSLSADIIWSQIANQNVGNVTDAQHRPLEELLPDGVAAPSGAVYFENQPLANGCDAVARGEKNPLAPIDVRPSFGVCNSRRSGFGRDNWREFDRRSFVDEHGQTVCPYKDGEFAAPYWKIQIPVIADESSDALSCQGMLNSGEDPILDPASSRYTIVGFITVGVYDVDIGEAPPSLSLFPKRNSEVVACSGIATQGGVIPEKLPDFPFGFRDASGASRSCNLIRARVDSNVKTLAGSNDSLAVAPVLVE